jgi:hypothetical protein
MSPKHPLIIAALLGASNFSQAEEVVTETTPIVPSTENLAPDLSAAPQPGDLPAEPVVAPAAPSQNVTVNLISRLVQKGILTQAEAVEMIQQAEADAQAAQAAALPPMPTSDEMRVTYIPEVVKNQMRDQIQQELMAQAREEKWSEKSSPDWTSKFRPFGDLRARYENQLMGEGNDPLAGFTNFNAINNGSPYDATNTLNDFPPSYNVDQDRQRTRLRARLGTEILLGDGFQAGVRLATGDSNSPTSTNQTFGSGNGNFSKYSIWLDRAFLGYDAGPGDGEELLFLLGRFDNPFLSTEIQWDDDVGFDGLAMRGKVKLTDQTSTFFTAGYFPVFNTDLNFASNQQSKFESTDKWLTGAQLGIEMKIADDLSAKVGLAYYDFSNISGELSSPYIPLSANDPGNTDSTRNFGQKGNTRMPIRNIDNSTAANDFGNKNQYQYYGLASEFRNLTLTGKIDYDNFQPVRLSLVGEVTKNIAFNETDVASRAYNNGKVGRTINSLSEFDGGDMAWNLAFQIGKPALATFGDWQAGFGYRYVESDAVVDAFTDSDFGDGGTNVQGFTLGGTMALSPAVRMGLRWMSSDEVSGPAFSTDILMLDLNAKF